MSAKDHIHRAIEIAGNQSRLAKAMGVKSAHIWNWLNRDGGVPAEFVLPLCAAVGWKVTPHELRPDIYPNPADALPPSGPQEAA